MSPKERQRIIKYVIFNYKKTLYSIFVTERQWTENLNEKKDKKELL